MRLIELCQETKNFILKEVDEVNNDRLCLHDDTRHDEIEEMCSFFETEASKISFTDNNGKAFTLSKKGFELYRGSKEIECTELPGRDCGCIISLVEGKAFTYNTNCKGEIINPMPVSNVVIC